MTLRLKEDPKEWRKFAAVAMVFVVAVAFVVLRRGGLTTGGFGVVAGTAIVWFGLGWVRPRWIRPFYRAAMSASHWLGQRVGWVLLAIFFLVFLTPLGLLLRLFGKDLLEIRRRSPGTATYWRPARDESSLDRLF